MQTFLGAHPSQVEKYFFSNLSFVGEPCWYPGQEANPQRAENENPVQIDLSTWIRLRESSGRRFIVGILKTQSISGAGVGGGGGFPRQPVQFQVHKEA